MFLKLKLMPVANFHKNSMKNKNRTIDAKVDTDLD